MRTLSLLPSLLLTLAIACGPRPSNIRPTTTEVDMEDEVISVDGPDPGEVPLGQLPGAVVPTAYDMELTVVPSRHGFHGKVEIAVQVTEETPFIWLHGNRLQVREVGLRLPDGEVIAARYEQKHDEGVALVTLQRAAPVGEATLVFDYDAPFNRALRGLYRVDQGEDHYAFTQFEATSARLCFPGFDEPRFKTPFRMTMIVPKDEVAAFNTPVAEESDVEGGELRRVVFAPTERLPTYLVAIAVGPMDVVEVEPIPPSDIRDRPVPLRGLAARGKGEQLAYALEHTGRILADLETYFGRPYPYAKLDIAAVPDFAAGAMENAGLVTFREQLLLAVDSGPEWQRRAYAYVMAHELAHQWFGNLVTMAWWDDLWLNEAFATWMGAKSVENLYPDYHEDLARLSSVQSAMAADSLVTARQIRQPIESYDDIRNAFDAITYRKGGGVLNMFERWMGAEVFQRGIQQYMEAHAWGNATFEDLLAALSESAGRDVATPFRTFLFQPGLPFLNTAVSCEGDAPTVTLTQSRYLPVGSQGDAAQTWQLPVCVRYQQGREVKTQCELVSAQEHTMTLEGACPAWVMPNADGAGYLRFALEDEWLGKLQGRGWSRLTELEQLAVADSVEAAFNNATAQADVVYGNLEPFARSTVRPLAEMPMGLLGFARDYLADDDESRDAVRAAARRLYTPQYRRLRFEPRRNEDGEAAMLRASVVSHLAFTGMDAGVRREAVRRAHRFLGHGRGGDGELHPDAVDANLVATVLAVAVQEGDAAFFDLLLERFAESDDALLRGHILGALGSTKDPELSLRAMALALDERVRVNELYWPMRGPLTMRETRDAAWGWVQENFDALAGRLEQGAGRLPRVASGFCSEEKAQEVEAFFTPRLSRMPGGPRVLANTLEEIRLCAAKVAAHREHSPF